MINRSLKKLVRPLAGTPLHPQWLAQRKRKGLLDDLRQIGSGKVVLDIGCFDKWPAALLDESCCYIGLDYYQTATEWYGSRPDCFADALDLPFADASVDVVLLLDVLEHVADSGRLFSEISRVLKPGGRLLMQTPFLYPLHDEPRDFYRYTSHAYEVLATGHGLRVAGHEAVGQPAETAALLGNLALCLTFSGWLQKKSLLSVFILLLPCMLLFRNLAGALLGALAERNVTMPMSYRYLFEKI